jgi:hypothetical protein
MGGIALLATAMQSLLHSRIGFRLPSGSVSLSDDEIIELACKRRSTGMKFQALWNGDWNSYFNSASEADSSIVFTLAYFTKDAAQIDRLFRRSQLMREKWDQKHGNESYGQRTIAKALSKVTKQYEPKKKRPASPKQGSQPPANLGFPKGAIDWDFKSDQTECSSCAWHQIWSPWGNASHWLMQPGDRHSAVPGGRMLAKVRCVRHVPGTTFRAPGAMLAIG